MGVSILYQAIPLQSALYRRLQEDRAFNTLFGALFSHGCGVLHLVAFAPEEAEDLFEDAMDRYPETLGPEPEARQRIADFCSALEQTRKDFPDIELRILRRGELLHLPDGTGLNVQTMQPALGYVLSAPGKKRRVLTGVRSDAAFACAAAAFFKRSSPACPVSESSMSRKSR